MSSYSKRLSAVIIGIVLVGAGFVGGAYYGTHTSLALVDVTGNVVNKETGKPDSVDFAPFWKAWNILSEKFVETHNGSTTTEQEKVWGAIKGLAESYGDPYTTFFPPVENKEFQQEISGAFEGVGMEVGMKDDILTVIAPIKGAPAEKAGVKAGDKILKINTLITTGVSVDEAVKLMRGEKGTQVTLTLLSEQDQTPREITITRDTIAIPTINTEKRSDGIFVISLYSFSENSPNLFRKALEEFVKSGSNKLILDLRGNPGGYLDAAVDMASWFLPKGKVVVKEDSGGKNKDHEFTSFGYDIFNENLQMIILVDGGSASAAEILSGALREHGIARLVGQKTFGKGSVQELVQLTPETSLKVTIARWLTPNGVSISAQGLKPDVDVPITEDDIKNKNDAQMNKAVELLLKNK